MSNFFICINSLKTQPALWSETELAPLFSLQGNERPSTTTRWRGGSGGVGVADHGKNTILPPQPSIALVPHYFIHPPTPMCVPLVTDPCRLHLFLPRSFEARRSLCSADVRWPPSTSSPSKPADLSTLFKAPASHTEGTAGQRLCPEPLEASS